MAPSSFLQLPCGVCVKIFIIQPSDKTGDCNKFRVFSGQINNILLPHLFHSTYYSMCQESEEGCNLFYPLGLVDMWHCGFGRIARIEFAMMLRFFQHLSETWLFWLHVWAQPLHLSFLCGSSAVFSVLRMCRELRCNWMCASCCKAPGMKSGKVFLNWTDHYWDM